MRFSLWIAAVVAALLALLGSVLRGQRGPDRDRAQPRQASCAPTSAPACTSSGRWSRTARVFDRRLQVLDAEPERYLTSEQQGRQRRLLRDRPASRTCARSTAPPAATKSIAIAAPGADHQGLAAQRDQLAHAAAGGVRRSHRVIGKQLDAINKRRRHARREDHRHPHQAHRPAAGQQRDQVGLRPHARAAPAGRQPAARRRRGAGADDPRPGRPRAGGDRRPRPSATRRSCAARAMPKPPRIYAQAASRDPAFYAFQRSLEAYRKSFADGEGVIVLERDDPFLQYLRSDR